MGNYYKEQVKKSRTDEEERNGRSRRNKKKKKSRLLIAFIITVLVVSVVAVGGYAIFDHFYGQINYSPTGEDIILDSIEPDDEVSSGPEANESDVNNAESSIIDIVNNSEIEVARSEDVINILLIGSDGTSKDERGRSDSMIIVSIDEKKEKITMTSILRDSYVYVPGIGFNKMNAAYSYGGASLLVETIEKNFKIDINRYANVNFISFVDIIDSIGGVNISVTNAEVEYMNKYMIQINEIVGNPLTKYHLSSGGTYNLNGVQALAYCRIRYIGTDFGRTERQRKVMAQIFADSKDLGIGEITSLSDKLVPNISTDMTEGDIAALLLKATDYLDYDLVSQYIPVDNSWNGMVINKADVLVLDMEKNIRALQESIYGE